MLYQSTKTNAISFPLGGIGTGCIGLAGNGELIDWEIFNRPNKNTRNGYSHFAIRATVGGKTAVKVLHGDVTNELSGRSGHGVESNTLAGFPHFRHVTFEGEFPLAHLSFADDDFPANVRLTAFNPMIPHNVFDSSLPVALFEWEIENPTDEPMDCALAFSVRNPALCSKNHAIRTDGESGIFFVDAEKPTDDIRYADLCALTDAPDSTVQEYWYRGDWQDACTTYWNNFAKNAPMPERHYDGPCKWDHGTVVANVSIAPHATESVRFTLAWNVPNAYNYWSLDQDDNGQDFSWKNYYATQFATSRESAEYALGKFADLKEQSQRFAAAMKDSTLPPEVYDAVSANLSVLKSPTVLRLTDGALWGWEGCNEQSGSCEGSCQHVWNYAYALPYLFPELERSLRETTIRYALTDTGESFFRIDLPLGRTSDRFHACVDGQMGEIIKCYREWKLSGDDAWFKKHAPAALKMLEYAWSPDNPDRWDADADGVLEGRQHHTLDMELFGPSSWLQGLYLLALECGARMADALGETDRAAKYRAIHESGKAWTNEHLFNGRYFYQKIDLTDHNKVAAFGATGRYWNTESGQIKYQVADGCIIDQMLADWHAALIGLPAVFDRDKKHTALTNLYKNNYVSSMRNIANMWRNFAINDESGTIICSYPEGCEKPAIPISYCDEVMTGFEYALAGLMLQNGFIAEGERMVRAVRDRYDGEKRNPWSEIECGSNYARSMASFALLPIYSGFSFDMTRREIGFAPIGGKGKFLWSVADSWGTVEITDAACALTVLGKPLTPAAFGLPDADNVVRVLADGEEISFTAEDGQARFAATVRDTLELVKK